MNEILGTAESVLPEIHGYGTPKAGQVPVLFCHLRKTVFCLPGTHRSSPEDKMKSQIMSLFQSFPIGYFSAH